MPFCQLLYQFGWATQDLEPVVTPRIEAKVYGFLRMKAVEMGGMVFAVNGMPDHVHLVASVPPSVALADFVGQLKGFSSRKLNQAKLRVNPLLQTSMRSSTTTSSGRPGTVSP